MPSLRRTAAAVLAGCLLMLVSSLARAAPSIVAASGNPYPDRVFGSNDEGQLSTDRQPPFDQTGASYSDCMGDMHLIFTLTVAGFPAGQQVQAWAGIDGVMCGDAAARTGTSPSCWPLATPYSVDPGDSRFEVRLQDIVGYQPGGTAPSASYTPLGSSACLAQSGPDAVTIDVWFLPLDGANNVVANALIFDYQLVTDLVGPPPPASLSTSIMDGSLGVSWAPNSDTDTIGYDVFMDPPPLTDGGTAPVLDSGADTGPVTECPDAADAGCFTIGTGTAPAPTWDGGQTCANVPASFSSSSSIISDASIPDAGVADTGVLLDEAGMVIDSGVVVEAGAEAGATSGIPAGIGTIDPVYQIQSSGSKLTVLGKANGSVQVNNLTDGAYYAFVVSAVDGLGNVGPPSGQQCQDPGGTQDFFQTYKQDGGAAGGGCAFESMTDPTSGGAVAGVGLLVAASAWRRRRSSRRSERA